MNYQGKWKDKALMWIESKLAGHFPGNLFIST